MSSLIWFLTIASIVLIIVAAPSAERRHPGPSWFQVLPFLVESKKRRGRAQQTHRHGARRYGTR